MRCSAAAASAARAFLSCFALGLGLSDPAAAQIAPGAVESPVSVSAPFQTAPAVAVNAAGDVAVVVWQRQSPAGDWDVYGRLYRLDAAGALVASGTEFTVNTSTGGCQQFPSVAADALGNFVVAWQSDQDPGGASGVYARRFAASGTALDAVEVRVATTVAGNQTLPTVAVAPDGRYLVAWQSDAQAGGQGWDIAAQAFGTGGVPSGPEILVNTTTAGAQVAPRAAWLAAPSAANTGFVVVWEGTAGIAARRVSASGGAIDAAEFAVSSTATGTQRNPAVAADLSGNYVVAWESLDAEGAVSRILARRFQGAAPLNAMTDLTVDAGPSATAQRAPTVAAAGTGDWLVAWESAGEDGDGSAIVAQEFDRRQVAAGGKVVLDAAVTAGDQGRPAVALTQGGGWVAAWQSVTPAVDAAVVEARAGSLAAGLFYSVAPCRLVDTRNAIGPLGGPALAPGVVRVLPLVSLGSCGIPATAKALAVNATAVGATASGFLAFYPGDGSYPGVSTVNYSVARSTISNNAHVLLSRDGAGTLAVVAGVSGVHLVLDVDGYYQ